MKITALAKYLLNYIYPLRCECCGKPLHPLDEVGICGRCIATVKKNPRPFCNSCGRSLETPHDLCPDCRRRRFHFARAYSAYLHEGATKKLVHAFKYRNRANLARALSRLMIDFVHENAGIIEDVDAITFVPLERGRLRTRRYNQSRILAEALAKEFNMPLMDSLEKIRPTRPQNELLRNDRLENLKGAIRAKGAPALDRMTVLLIDDVMATGATLDESAKALKAGGAAEVRCLTFSRGL